MIRQHFTLESYEWECTIFYVVTGYDLDTIMEALYEIGCRGENLRTAYHNISADKLDTGLTYSNIASHETIIVVAKTSDPKEFEKSWRHECGHLATHICQAYDIDLYGEEIHYIGDEIVEKTWDMVKPMLCEHCRKIIMSSNENKTVQKGAKKRASDEYPVRFDSSE